MNFIDVSKGEKNEGVPISAEEHAARISQTRVIVANKPDQATLTAQERARLENRDANVREHQNNADIYFRGAVAAGQLSMPGYAKKFENAAIREDAAAREAGSVRGKW